MPTLNVLTTLRHATLGDILDIFLIAFVLYSLFLIIKDTKAYPMAIGLGLVGLLFLLTQWGQLVVSNRLIRSFINYIIIAVIVLFQGEIRRFLTGIGSRTFRKPLALRSFQEKFEDLFLALEYLSQKRSGPSSPSRRRSPSRRTSTGGHARRPAFEGPPGQHLLPASPLHDGAVIIQGNKIVAAGCSPASPGLP